MRTFKPDSKLVSRVVPSPNHGPRRRSKLRPKAPARPDLIVLHYTGMKSADGALSRLTVRDSEVSSHYLVYEDGSIVQLVPEKRRAWHAGVSSWNGETDINSRSVGIEIANPGHEFGYPAFPRRQIDAVIALCRDIMRRQRIRPEGVVAHSDIAPARKQDPGEKFPWRRLARAGVGVWTRPAPIRKGRALAPGQRGAAVTGLQQALASFGFGIAATGAYDPATADVVAAFQRRHRPARVDGIADASTIATLRRLLARWPARKWPSSKSGSRPKPKHMRI
jgi:N-acetylmuramoyl-L-alanine amidase